MHQTSQQGAVVFATDVVDLSLHLQVKVVVEEAVRAEVTSCQYLDCAHKLRWRQLRNVHGQDANDNLEEAVVSSAPSCFSRERLRAVIKAIEEEGKVLRLVLVKVLDNSFVASLPSDIVVDLQSIEHHDTLLYVLC